MEKPYDLKDLAGRLKGRGLDVAEESAKILLEEFCGWGEESAKLSVNPFDDMALIVLPQLKSFALSQIDKIDGQEG